MSARRRERLALWAVIAACLLAAAGILAARAAARPIPPPMPIEGWGPAMVANARAYWGIDHPPDCATERITFGATLPAGDAGRATEPTEPGEDCTMEIGTAFAAEGSRGLYWTCLTVVHEYGHWLGLPHSADPSSPMAAILNRSQWVRSCGELAQVSRYYVTHVTHKRRIIR